MKNTPKLRRELTILSTESQQTMTKKYIQLAAIITILIGLLTYLAMVNFRLPFMAIDELRYILSSPKGAADYALASGRYSSLIMVPLSEILSFSTPTYPGLFPRFVSMLLLLAAVVLLLRKMSMHYFSSILLSAFVLMTHEIDWQHNGLVSFFGIYNVLLSLFVCALILDRNSFKNIWIPALIFVLLVGSYASELFIGLSFCYVALKATMDRQVKPIIRSPFFWSLALYIAVFLALKAVTSLKSWNADQMATYLVGSVGVYGTSEMLKAALLYFINSLPFYHALNISESISVYFSAFLMVGIGGYLFKIWNDIKKADALKPNFDTEKRKLLLAAMVFLLAVTPNFLIALQPMKVDWILRGASVHYAFSYYTWIGLAIVCAYFAKQNIYPIRNRIAIRVFSLLAAFVLVGVMLLSAKQNIDFTKEYDASLSKWIQLNKILKQNESKEIVISPEYLEHPYITAMTADQLKEYAKRLYNTQLHICSSYSEIELNENRYGKKVLLEGFSVAEANGRWTDGSIASIKIEDKNPKINFIELEISSIFAGNLNTPAIVSKGNKTYKFKLSGLGKHLLVLPDGIEGELEIQFLISSPASPLALGLGSDKRNLGLMLKNVKMGFRDSAGQEDFTNMESCY